jgi:hypothetical protein
VSRPQLHSLTLRRHPIVLAPRLALLFGTLGVVVGISAWLHNIPLLLVGAAPCGIAITLQLAAWWMFTVTIRYDRVKVRRLRFIFVRQTTYTLPGLGGLTYEQQLLEKTLNAGTLILRLPDRSIRFTMLTPYSALDAMLGW